MEKPPTQQTLVGGSVSLILFIISAIIGLWVAYDSSLSWPIFLTLLGSIGLFFAIVNAAISPRLTTHGLVILAGLVALYFVGQYAYFDYQDEVGSLARLGRITGSLLPNLIFFTPQPNAAAGFLEGTLLLGLVLIWQARGSSRLVWTLTTVIIAYGLLVSESRGAWSGLAVAIGIWILLRFPKQAPQLASLGLGLGTALLFTLCVIMRLPGLTIPFLGSIASTSNSRLNLYRSSLALLGDYPFTGIGLGDTFALLYSRYQLLIHVPFLYYAHNLFLSVGLGQGILGLVALVWMLIDFYRFVIRVERIGLNTRSRLIFRAAWLGTTTSLIHGLTDSVQFSGDYWTMPMVFALAGLSIAMGRPALARIDSGQEVNRVSTGRYHHWKWGGLGTIVIGGLAITIAIYWQIIASAWYANIGAIYQAQADLSPKVDAAAREVLIARSIVYYESALNLNPSQAVANRRLGIMALERQDFETATLYLERAYSQEPRNQATLKALGYTYLWTGQPDQAQRLFRRVYLRDILVGELRYWHWWWGTQDRLDLSAYAGEMAQRLSFRRR